MIYLVIEARLERLNDLLRHRNDLPKRFVLVRSGNDQRSDRFINQHAIRFVHDVLVESWAMANAAKRRYPYFE